MGNGELVDSMIHDGLWCAFDAVHMGAGTENYVGQVGNITREAQDEFAAKSHERAAAAQKEGRFADEIAPVEIAQRKGDPIVIDSDEGVRPGTTTESLSKLRPAFSKDGTITAGNASQISDGGAAVIVASRAAAERLGLTPLAELVGFGMVAGPDTSLLHQPSNAISARSSGRSSRSPTSTCSRSTRRSPRSGIASMKDLGISDDVVNVNGGAIALGHPVGMSGTRIVDRRSSTSCGGAAAARARRHSAVAAVRATPRSCARSRPARQARLSFGRCSPRRTARSRCTAGCDRWVSGRSSTTRSRSTGGTSARS